MYHHILSVYTHKTCSVLSHIDFLFFCQTQKNDGKKSRTRFSNLSLVSKLNYQLWISIRASFQDFNLPKLKSNLFFRESLLSGSNLRQGQTLLEEVHPVRLQPADQAGDSGNHSLQMTFRKCLYTRTRTPVEQL